MSLNLYPTFLDHEETYNQDPFTYPHGNQLTNTSMLNSGIPLHGSNQFGLPFDNLDPIEIPDIPDTCFNYITNLLSEQDSNDQLCTTLEDYMAAQHIYNKSLDYTLLGETCSSSLPYQYPPSVPQTSPPLSCFDDYFNMFSYPSDHAKFGSSSVPNDILESQMMPFQVPAHIQYEQPIDLISNRNCESNITKMYPNIQFEPVFEQSSVGHSSGELINSLVNFESPIDCTVEILASKSKARKHGCQEDNERSVKQLAHSNEVFEQIEQYGDVLLCPEGRNKPAGLCSTINKANNTHNSYDQKLQNKEMTCSKGSKKRGSKSQVVDLKSLLSRCAQCVARVDLSGAYELLKQIRHHSSPYGDYLQRLAHYLANGLEARLEGKGLEITRANEQISPCEVLKANRVYVASVPFKIMSYYTTNKTIAKLVEEAPSIHIIDFGIFYGLQWPCIIQNLSKRPSGPPKIRITGIDFPQCGFRPAERVEETGHCLAKYCERYNVPFEYHAIAKKWEQIEVEDLKIARNEPLVVNCLYRSHNLYDESVEEHSPRDAFLSLVRKINPDIFMHGVVNSTLSVPFFLNRFKEALFHYTALFDLFEATMKREDNERMLLESKLYGNQALNVIACEGIERIERPETYKQWQVRTQRAGFVQVPLDRELLRRARAMVRRNFRVEFSYDEDDYWVVQGWKGRILYAISCWKPQEA